MDASSLPLSATIPSGTPCLLDGVVPCIAYREVGGLTYAATAGGVRISGLVRAQLTPIATPDDVRREMALRGDEELSDAEFARSKAGRDIAEGE